MKDDSPYQEAIEEDITFALQAAIILFLGDKTVRKPHCLPPAQRKGRGMEEDL